MLNFEMYCVTLDFFCVQNIVGVSICAVSITNCMTVNVFFVQDKVIT